MKFIAERNGKKLKTFQAKGMESIYNQFNKYCKYQRKAPFRVETNESFGGLAWRNKDGIILLKKVD